MKEYLITILFYKIATNVKSTGPVLQLICLKSDTYTSQFSTTQPRNYKITKQLLKPTARNYLI